MEDRQRGGLPEHRLGNAFDLEADCLNLIQVFPHVELQLRPAARTKHAIITIGNLHQSRIFEGTIQGMSNHVFKF